MNVQNVLDIFEVDEEDAIEVDGPKLIVKSHWSDEDLVVLEFENKKITVKANELIRAINNATNV